MTTSKAVYLPGQVVQLVPTQGGHQKPRAGKVISVSEKQVTVLKEGDISPSPYWIESGRPVRKFDQQFPCYHVRPAAL